jgi:PAS domain S-box-containing protein
MAGSTTRPDSATAATDRRFRAVVESVKDYAIFMLDADGRVRTWNAGAQIIKGYRPDEIIGQRLEVFYAPEDRQRGLPAELLAQAARDGRAENEGWRLRKDGSRFWADVVITAFRDPSGEVSGFAKVTRDLTERHNAEEERARRENELARSEERFRLLVEAVEDYAIFMLDPQGRVATWNGGAERIKGYQAKEIVGRHFSCFRLPDEVRAGRCEQELALAAERGSVEEEGWRVRKDGSRFWANVVLTAIRGAAGELLGFTKVTRDLTERRRLDDERLRRALAEEAVRLRDEFLSIASHELKTPLTTLQIELRGLAERLGADADADADRKLVKRVERAARSADRMGALIESLLDVGRIAAGNLSLKPERLDLSRELAAIVDNLQGIAAAAGCELTLRTTATIIGFWDRLRLGQVVMNLAANAFKYGAGAPVTVSAFVEGGEAVIQVVDGGPGIPEQDLGRIFGRFERAAPIRNYGGLGLGLYVSHQIVSALGGAIEARNRAEGGACFTVRLPCAGAIDGRDHASAAQG